MHEPVAACLAFGQDSSKFDQEILVLDLGSKQFNVTHISYHDGLFIIKDSREYNNLAGKELDQVLVDFAMQEFQRKFKVDISDNRRSVQKLRIACERTKRSLTRQDTAPISVESLYDGMDYNSSIPRARYEMLCDPIYAKCKDAVKEGLKSSGLGPDQIDSVLLIGGCGRIPRFQQQMRSLFPGTTSFRTDIESDEAISMGCAVQAGLLKDQNFCITAFDKSAKCQTLSQSIGILCPEFQPLLPKGTPIPVIRKFQFPIGPKQTEAFLALNQESERLAELCLTDLETGENRMVTVVLCIEDDGVLQVSMTDNNSGQRLDAKIQ